MIYRKHRPTTAPEDVGEPIDASGRAGALGPGRERLFGSTLAPPVRIVQSGLRGGGEDHERASPEPLETVRNMTRERRVGLFELGRVGWPIRAGQVEHNIGARERRVERPRRGAAANRIDVNTGFPQRGHEMSPDEPIGPSHESAGHEVTGGAFALSRVRRSSASRTTSRRRSRSIMAGTSSRGAL